MASEQFSYVFTETAEADVDAAFDYITNELSNTDAASDSADTLDEKLEEICRTPKAGHPVRNPYLRRSDVRRVLIKNYIAYYLIDEESSSIVVLRVIYSGRDQDKILGNL